MSGTEQLHIHTRPRTPSGPKTLVATMIGAKPQQYKYFEAKLDRFMLKQT